MNSESSKSNETIGIRILNMLITFAGKTVLNKGKCMIICKLRITPNILDNKPYNHIDESAA